MSIAYNNSVYSASLEIVNNTIAFMGEDNIDEMEGGNGIFVLPKYTKYINNILYHESTVNNDYGTHEFLRIMDKNVVVRNNIFYGDWETGVPADLDSVNLETDPLFTDLDKLDFSLSKFSPGIDVGDPRVGIDPDETDPDIGAIYYHQQYTELKRPTINESLNNTDGNVVLKFGAVITDGLTSYNYLGQVLVLNIN